MTGINNSHVKLVTQFNNLTSTLQQKLTTITENKINQFSNSYFRRILKKNGAEIRIQLQMEKNKHDRYIGHVHFFMDNHQFRYHTDTPFKEPYDVIHHAFKRLKESMSG